METIKLKIDNKVVEVAKGTTILKAAREAGIHIPTLCYLHLHDLNIENKPAGCRVCVVEVEGRRNLAPACVTECTEGMVVNTHNIRVLNSRKTVLELILSDHPTDCLICAKNGNCELQSMAQEFGIRKIHYEGEQSTYREDTSPAIIRDIDKCIMCRRCEMMCNDVQTVGVLSAVNRGFMSVVAPAFEMNLDHSVCTYCGQCVAVCPTGALTEVDHTNSVIRALADPTKTVVVQAAPAVRAALGEEFGLEAGTLVTGKMAAALRRLGFDYVFDTDFAADLTIMEEGTELLDRLTRHLNGDKNVPLPILTSCCPGWVNFFEHQFPEMMDIPSTARSPQQMFGAIAKTYFADKIGVKRENLVVVSIMPCLAKKYECQRDEFATDGNPDVDFSISTRELSHLIKQSNIEFNELPEEDFDHPLGESTGAAVIFGATGGVMEAALRTAYEIVTGREVPFSNLNITPVRGMDGVKEASIKIEGCAPDWKFLEGAELKVAIAHGLVNANKIMRDVREGKSPYHFVEIMACPGGCIGGGGQPIPTSMEIRKNRMKAIYSEDEHMVLRKSHENPDVIAIYEEFLDKPNSHKSHELLHTHYVKRENY